MRHLPRPPEPEPEPVQVTLEFPPEAPHSVRMTLDPLFSITTEHSSRMYTVLDQHLARQTPPLMLRTGFHLRYDPAADRSVLSADVVRVPVRRARKPLPGRSRLPSPASPKAGPWH